MFQSGRLTIHFHLIPIALVDSETYDNYDGLDAIQNENDSSKIVIQDVISKNNKSNGISFSGTGITVKNANSRNNGKAGLHSYDNTENQRLKNSGLQNLGFRKGDSGSEGPVTKKLAQ